MNFKARLTQLFKELEERGDLIARQDLECCPEAVAELEALLDEEPGIVGIVHYRRRSAATVNCGHIHILYGSHPFSDEASIQIGIRIIIAATKHRLVAKWNGSPASTIVLRMPEEKD